MSVIRRTYGKRRIRELAELRDEALKASYYEGTKRAIGNISIGSVKASWFPEDGSQALLQDQGLRINTYYPTFLFTPKDKPPTRLDIFGDDEEREDLEVVTSFFMDLNPGVGFVDIYHHLMPLSIEMTKKTVKERIKSRRIERKSGLAMPSEEDLELLHEEMRRGASGAYAIKDVYENE